LAFLYTDEQQAIASAARRQLSARFNAVALRAIVEQGEGYDIGYWRLCRECGWTGVTIDQVYGGLGLGLIELCLIAEATGHVIVGAPFLSTSFGVADAISNWGSDAQKLRWLPGLAAGEVIGAVASTEGATLAPVTPATTVSGGHIHGAKLAVTAGAVASLGIVQALGEDGRVALYAVELSDTKRTVLDSFDPSRGAAHLDFDGETAERLPTSTAASLATLLSRMAVVVAAEQIGGADACITLARDYACTRQAFGQPIGKFQSIKHGIAEMWVLSQLGRAATADAAHRFDHKDAKAILAAAAARLNASEAYERAAWLATQVHGAVGVTWEANLHLHYRRARALALELGQPAIWEDTIVSALEHQT
jgi:acyl-CoA dehydrogenase